MSTHLAYFPKECRALYFMKWTKKKMLLLQYRLVIHQSSNFSWLGFESSMNAYRYTIVVLPLHHVFGSPDLSPWCLSGFDLPIWFPPVFHSNASRSLHLMYCFPTQMMYLLAFSRFHKHRLDVLLHHAWILVDLVEIFFLQVSSCVEPCFTVFPLSFPSEPFNLCL